MSSFSIKEFFSKILQLGTKHNYAQDFGYPEIVTFEHLYRMYRRNDLAKAAVQKTTEKTFQTLPKIMVGETENKDVAEAFERLGMWDKMADIDEWAQVSGYSGFVLRISDDKEFNQPVEGNVGLDDIVEIIPAWSEQLKVSEWHMDQTDSDNYGKPKTFTYHEAAIESEREGAQRSVVVHPDRVFIWSADGTVKCDSTLLSGYNNLLDMEKISGAGGEGFWKTAAQRMNIEIDSDTDFGEFQRQTEAQTGKTFQEALDEKVKKVNEGFDTSFITQGMKVEPFQVSLPQPKEFFDIPLMSFAAPRMPVKILVGNQTGERASTEDAQEWNNTIKSRRNRWVQPSIRNLLLKLEGMGAMPAGWIIEWEELTDDTPAKRLDRAHKMADINQKANDDVYDVEDIRRESGHEEFAA